MTDRQTEKAPSRWWERMLDGQHDWGSLETSPPRNGVSRFRLVVYPPGIDGVDRRLLRIWRAWPTWGALIWLAVQIALGALLTPLTAFAVSTIAYVGGGIVLFGLIAELRTRVRTLTVVRMAGYSDEHSKATFVELNTLVSVLWLADTERDSGRWSPAEHEAAWWQVYDRLGQLQLGSADVRATR
jgi:hypothetical protein